MERQLTFGSLFAGIGGFDLGFENAGMKCAWMVEKDEFCQKILKKHWPNVPLFDDVKHFNRDTAGAVDVICGGFPCQPHSLAGKQKGAADERDLWPEMRRVISEFQPTWVACENVPGIRRTILPGVLADLEALGYETADIEFPACAFGAPHRRARMFILAHSRRGSVQRPGERGDAPGTESEGACQGPQRQRIRNAAGNGSESMADGDVEGCGFERIEKPGGQQGAQGNLADGCSEVRQLDNAEAGLVYAEVESERAGLREAEGENGDAWFGGRRSRDASRENFWSDAAWIVCDDGTGKKCTRRVKAKAGTLPEIHSVADGFPMRLARLDEIEPLVVPHFKGRREQLRALGNALVPQIAEFIGRHIIKVEECK